MRTTAPVLIASDIDGTLLRTGQLPSAEVRAAASAVRAAGHHLVLSTGRSLVGALPVALALGLDDAWIVASNGAVTARLVGDRYQVTEQHDVDAEAVVRVAVAAAPGVRVAAEMVGDGYRVNTAFPEHELNGAQHRVVGLEQLWQHPTPRVALHGPEAYRLVWPLRALGLTAIATRTDWVDVTAPEISKASALEKIRTGLGVELDGTVAIGDSENDVEMLGWAAHGWAMGHAPAFVIAAADHVTGSIDDDGAVGALLSVLA
ncbi:HAD family hydrolase [Promicromonospora thailandica]|uniref:HAD-superfamily hydrolase, subfamily IIB n=1 Tax=Promicromonospora thailandica TaxID=765201 RepID=A0A9X2G2F1_9MICO|nr:HAD-IIB family hydrolase [Promicromonospora thailandica]MCP2265589.1 HAD-superfamily hydrolase, subfamily IIB [Promicromonospora thailandica]BFF17150.1 HAD family hydrolase [Promicromonospora thailandica]